MNVFDLMNKNLIVKIIKLTVSNYVKVTKPVTFFLVNLAQECFRFCNEKPKII